MHAEQNVIYRQGAGAETAKRRQQEESAMLLGLILAHSVPLEAARAVVSRVMEAPGSPEQDGEGEGVKMLLGLNAAPGLRDKLARCVADEIEAMPPERRERWMKIMGERQEGDNGSSMVKAAARALMGHAYALQEREELARAARVSMAAKRPGL